MKKIGKKINNNIKLLIAFVVGLLISGTAVYATCALSAASVTYTSNGQSTVNGALNELYTRTSSITTYKNLVCPGCVYRKSNTVKYNRNAESATDSNSKLTSSEYTTDYTTLNSNYFLGHVIDSSGNIFASYACGINNGVFFCLRGVDSSQSSLTYNTFYQENVNRMNQVFSRCNANTSRWSAFCSGYVDASADSYGAVGVNGGGYCQVYQYGYSYCS